MHAQSGGGKLTFTLRYVLLEQLPHVGSYLYWSTLCLCVVSKVQDGVIVAVFENREAGQKARAYMSEFGIGEGTLLRCDVYDGEQFIAKTMEAMQVREMCI